MRYPLDMKFATPFMDNFYCEIAGRNLAFVAIAKNAVTYLKSIAIYTKTGYVVKNEDEAHSIVGYNAQSIYLHSIHDGWADEKEGLIKFAVWRDPVERLVSCYKFFCLERNERDYFLYLNLYNDNSFEHFMEFVRLELGKKDPVYQDEHIRRQSDHYSPADVDYIVSIRDLNCFLSRYDVPLIKKCENATHAKFELTEQSYIDEIRDLYKSDYELLKNSNDKAYVR